MLHLLKLHNFKTFLNSELTFHRRHLVIGRNNSGKTNLGAALKFLGSTASSDLATAASSWIPGGITELGNWHLKSAETEFACRCTLGFDEQPCEFEYSLTLRRSAQTRVPVEAPGLEVALEQLKCRPPGSTQPMLLIDNNGTEALLLHEEQAIQNGNPHRPKTLAPRNGTMLSRLYELESNRRAVLFRTYLQNWAYYSLSPYAMRFAQPSKAVPPVALDPFGSMLSTSLYYLKNLDEQRYRRVLEHVRLVEPDLEAINFIPVPDDAPRPFLDLRHHPRSSWLGLSDGTLRVLALALIIERASGLSPPHSPIPSLAVIEEPENGLFPGQLRQIFDLFQEWAPSSQFLFTSHSPYFIDMFDDDRGSVTVLKKASDRSEAFTPREAMLTDDSEPLPLSMEYASELLE